MAGGLLKKARAVMHAAAFGIGCPKDQALDARVADGTRAHGAGFKRHIKPKPPQPVIAQSRPPGPQRQDFCVRRGIVQSDRGVGPLPEHPLIGAIPEQRADGGLPRLPGFDGGGKRPPHQHFIARGVLRIIRPMHVPKPNEPSLAGESENGERIAKVLARAGVCSRRDAERLIAEGRVSVNALILMTPAHKVQPGDAVRVDGQLIAGAEPPRMWRYHKPSGLVTTHKDPKGRPTVFEHLPEGLPRVISVGRLDLTSEGLLLLTNDGTLARRLELPANGWVRRYRARAHGQVSQAALDALADGLTIAGVRYGPIKAALERQVRANAWIEVAITEGKNREVRRVLEHIGLTVNRLIRTAYGPFELGLLKPGTSEEISRKSLRDLLSP